MDPKYISGAAATTSLLAGLRYPLVRLGDVAISVDYGISARATSESSGVPILRMVNLRDDGWELSDLKYVPADLPGLARMRLEPGDLLFNRTNSEELVGKCAVFDDPRTFVFASYLIRIRVDPRRLLPDFVALFLGSEAGRTQINRVSRRIIGMANINAAELRDLLVPVPPLDVQRTLVGRALRARRSRDEMLSESANLDAGIDEYVSTLLGLPRERLDPPLSYAVPLLRLRGSRLDATAHRASTPNSGAYPFVTVAALADTNRKAGSPEVSASGDVPYVGLPECDLRQVRTIGVRPHKEVHSRAVARPGDILLARIEPSVFNKKYVWAGDLHGRRAVYVSTEFHVLSPRADSVVPRFLYASLFTSHFALQVRGRTTGSSGRRRLDLDMLKSIELPLPPISIQREIAIEVERRDWAAERLRREAGEVWTSAKRSFLSDLVHGVDG